MLFSIRNITEADDPYYRYLLSYYQSYERYTERLRQMYPNITLPKVQQTYNPNMHLKYSKEIKDGVIILQSYEFFCTIRSDICNLLFACPPCPPANHPPGSGTASTLNFTAITQEQLTEKIQPATIRTLAPLDLPTNINEAELFTGNSLISNSDQLAAEASIYDEYVDYTETTSSVTTTTTANNNQLTPSSRQHGNGTIERSNSFTTQPVAHTDYTYDDMIEDDFQNDDDSDLLLYKNEETFKSRRRHKRQIYPIYPIHSQKYCVCESDASKENEIFAMNDVDMPESFLKLVKNCTVHSKGSNQTAETSECSMLTESQNTDDEDDLQKNMPLTKNDFKNCHNLNVSVENCSKARRAYLLKTPLERSVYQLQFNDDEARGHLNGSSRDDDKQNLNKWQNATAENLLDDSSNFVASFDKWLSPTNGKTFGQLFPKESTIPNSNELKLFNGVQSGSVSTNDFNIDLTPNDQDYRINDNADYINNVENTQLLQEFGGESFNNDKSVTQQIQRFEQGDSEEFVMQQTNPEKTSNDETNLDKSSLLITKSDGSESTTEQDLVALVDPESGVIPHILPSNLRSDKLKQLKNRSAKKAQDVKILHNSDSNDAIVNNKVIRPQKKTRKPKNDGNLASKVSKRFNTKCVVYGVDAVVYMDNTDVMPENNFIFFRKFINSFYQTLENDRRKCEEAYQMAIKLQADGGVNRKKIFLILTPRTQRQLRDLYPDIWKARQQANNSNLTVLPFAISNSYNEDVARILSSSNFTRIPAKARTNNNYLARWLCKYLSVSKTVADNGLKYCPWKVDAV
uniref:Serine/threonine-protein kinase DDB_G0282963 n=1 Tax=Syphacia muris TaxID=451379 RepID=A0A0N5AFA2_9BILA